MSTLGKQHSEETKAKISAALKGRRRVRRATAANPELPPNPGEPWDQREHFAAQRAAEPIVSDGEAKPFDQRVRG